jgi:hypothetical protein
MHFDCDERACARARHLVGAAWHHRVLGAAAGFGPASRVLVYLCFVQVVYKTRTHKSEFHAKGKQVSTDKHFELILLKDKLMK